MPNGESKNWVRLLITLSHFRLIYNSWPTSIYLYESFIKELSDKLLEKDFKKLKSKIKLIPNEINPFLAFDAFGNKYDYSRGTPQPPKTERPADVLSWLDINEPNYFD